MEVLGTTVSAAKYPTPLHRSIIRLPQEFLFRVRRGGRCTGFDLESRKGWLVALNRIDTHHASRSRFQLASINFTARISQLAVRPSDAATTSSYAAKTSGNQFELANEIDCLNFSELRP